MVWIVAEIEGLKGGVQPLTEIGPAWCGLLQKVKV